MVLGHYYGMIYIYIYIYICVYIPLPPYHYDDGYYLTNLVVRVLAGSIGGGVLLASSTAGAVLGVVVVAPAPVPPLLLPLPLLCNRRDCKRLNAVVVFEAS